MNNVIIAVKTLEAIEAMVVKDQGATFRGFLGKVIPHMDDAYRTDEDGHRSHMGASLIGGECARAIWYNFRWATKGNFNGRLLRLFNRGHLEEARFIALLLGIGCEVYQQDENGKQFRVSHANGHFGGSGDGVAIGVPDLPAGTPALLEFKTSADKPFQEVKKNGVRAAKFEHYVQMQIYMSKMGIAAALYMMVNKNNDDIHAEIVHLDTKTADQFLSRGEKLVWMEAPPPKLNESPGFWKCKFCDHRPVCHLGTAPDVNCRTCVHSKPIADAKWTCGKHGEIEKATQLKGCNDYQASEVFFKC